MFFSKISENVENELFKKNLKDLSYIWCVFFSSRACYHPHFNLIKNCNCKTYVLEKVVFEFLNPNIVK